MRTRKEMLEYIRREIRYGNPFPSGWCKRKSREAYLIPSDGTPNASGAWEKTDHRVKGYWVPGAFVWWRGGSDGDGHVAICRWRKGRIFTVDFPNVGRWNRTSIAALEAAWPSITWAGMSLDIDGVKVRRMPRFPRRWQH